jgi:hypothetical protein
MSTSCCGESGSRWDTVREESSVGVELGEIECGIVLVLVLVLVRFAAVEAIRMENATTRLRDAK